MSMAFQHNDFVHRRIEHGGGKRWALQAVCSSCEKTDDLPLGGGKGTLNQVYADRGFKKKGWELGKDRSSDRCPECVAADIANRRAAKEQADAILQEPPAAPRSPDWQPTPAELADYVRDSNPSIGGDKATRREGMTWYPRLTRGGERLARDIIGARLMKGDSGYRYAPGWSDKRVAEAVHNVAPELEFSTEMARMVRTQFWGLAHRKSPSAPKADPAPAAEPSPPPAPDDRVDRLEADLLHLFEEVEKAKQAIIDEVRHDVARMGEKVATMGKLVAAFESAMKHHNNRVDQLSERVERSGAMSKTLADYSRRELLAELARREEN